MMIDSTPTPADDELDHRVEDEVAPEEQLLGGWLPEPGAADRPVPAP